MSEEISGEADATPIELLVEPEHAGQRLDWYLAQKFPDYSRVHLRKLVNAATVLVEGRRTKAAHRLRPGERISVRLPRLSRPAPRPENIPLDILYEDEWLVAVNKPAGMVVHPGKGNYGGTLTSALQHHFDSLSQVGGAARPGIVHRLDRGTSGVLVVARTDQAHLRLSAQFADRSVEKEYFALVVGKFDRDRDWIDAPIGFHPHDREKMAIRRGDPQSRPAQTFFEVLERLGPFAALKLLPKTGRTHQIRVHLAHIGCPVLCDAQYGGRSTITRGEALGGPGVRGHGGGRPKDGASPPGDDRSIFASPPGDDPSTVILARPALHARRLAILHPHSGQRMEFIAPIPEDMTRTLETLRAAAFRAPGTTVD